MTEGGLCFNRPGLRFSETTEFLAEIMVAEQEPRDLKDNIEEILCGQDVQKAVEAISAIHPADRADIFERIDAELREAFLSVLSTEEMAELLEYLDEDVLEEVVERMPRATLARVLDKTGQDVAVDVLRMLSPSETARVISAMSTASEITPLLEHEDESAGGLMTRGYVALHPDMTVQQAITFLRLRKPVVEEVYYLYVLDAQNKLLGVVNLRELIVAPPDTSIVEVMTREPIAVTPETDQEEVARLIQHYRLRALPVVDDSGIIQGIITADDAMEVATEEATEDMYRMAGLLGDERVFSSVIQSVPRRLPWLVILLLFSSFSAVAVGLFESTIADLAILAAFMPIIAGQSGNFSIQVITLVVRGLAIGEVEPGDAVRIIAKEIRVGLISGLVIGALVGLIGWIVIGKPLIALILIAALAGNMMVAGVMGVFVPLTIRRLRLDPALGSGPFVTSLADVSAILIYLGLATLMLSQLT